VFLTLCCLAECLSLEVLWTSSPRPHAPLEMFCLGGVYLVCMVGVLFFAVFGHAATPVEQHMCWKRACIFGPA